MKKVIAITINVIVMGVIAKTKKIDASHCNNLRGNRFMQH